MDTSVLVVGAGVAGLSAARDLKDAGIKVTLLDKSRAVGGRMATRRMGDATFDHGVQSFDVNTEPFGREIGRLLELSIARSWSAIQPDGELTHVMGVGGMRRIPERWADGLDILTGVGVDRLEVDGGSVAAIAGDETMAVAHAAILTPPLPQTVRLLKTSGMGDIPAVDGLASNRYEATLAVMAVLGAPANLRRGHLALDEGPVAWIADNQEKGISATPALTIHSSPEFASQNLESDPEEWKQTLLEAARPHHDGAVLQARAHRWRYSKLGEAYAAAPLVIDSRVPLVLAGEAFGGPSVEGAYTSGRGAAAILLDTFS